MCDESVATRVRTPEGTLDFQEYFVRRHHGDTVLGVEYRGIGEGDLVPGAELAGLAKFGEFFEAADKVVVLGM